MTIKPWRRKSWMALLLTVGMGYGAWAQFGVLLGYEIPGEFFTARDGVRIHYVVEGTGEPLILVHGYAMNVDLSWRRPGVMDLLAQEYKVIAYDARGHGKSDKPAGVEHYGTAMVDDIVDLMDHLKVPRAHFVGQSMGGLTILKFVTRFPERVISAAPNAIGWERADSRNLETCDELADSLERGEGYGPLLERLAPADGRMGQLTKTTLETLVAYLNDTPAMASVARGLPQLTVSATALERNRVPVLTIIGTDDPLLGDAYELHEAMPFHELVTVNGADHFYVSGTPEFQAALMDFLHVHSHNAPEVIGVGA